MERARQMCESIPKIMLSAQFGLKFEPARERFCSIISWYAKLKRALMLVHPPIDVCSIIGAVAITQKYQRLCFNSLTTIFSFD